MSFGVAGFWFLIFCVSFWQDRRLFRNGIFLVLTLMFAGLGVIFALESVSGTAARCSSSRSWSRSRWPSRSWPCSWCQRRHHAPPRRPPPGEPALAARRARHHRLRRLRPRRPEDRLGTARGGSFDPDRRPDLHLVPVRLLPRVRVRLQPGPVLPEGRLHRRARRRPARLPRPAAAREPAGPRAAGVRPGAAQGPLTDDHHVGRSGARRGHPRVACDGVVPDRTRCPGGPGAARGPIHDHAGEPHLQPRTHGRPGGRSTAA